MFWRTSPRSRRPYVNWRQTKDEQPQTFVTKAGRSCQKGAGMKKYEPLGNYLAALPSSQERETLTFRKIEDEIIEAKLPRSAFEHRQWWANQDYGSRAYHWEGAGFQVDSVDQSRGIVTFRRVSAARPPRGSAGRDALDHALAGALRTINAQAGTALNLRSGRFTQQLNNRGGIGTVERALRPGANMSGFNTLLEAGRPDLTLEHAVLQSPFRDELGDDLVAEARRRLGYLENPDIRNVVAAIEEQAGGYRFGQLQKIRLSLKGLGRISKTIFRDETTFKRYAYHYGGRTELQFNVGFEETGDGKTYLRHGVAISLERGPAVTAITDETVTRIARLNEFIEDHGDEYTGFIMYNSWHDSDDWSGDHALRPVPPEVVRIGAFIFIGRRQSAAQASVSLILHDFDYLLAMYEFVEGTGVAQTLQRAEPPPFVPGLSRRPSTAGMSIAQRRLNKDLRHNVIQHALGQYLIAQHGKDAVRDELPTGNRTKVDLSVKDGESYIYYEIKVAETAQHCIRQALGQLLEYSYWPGARRAERLVIVAECAFDPTARRYLKDLQKKFGLPVEYRQFDMQTGQLREP